MGSSLRIFPPIFIPPLEPFDTLLTDYFGRPVAGKGTTASTSKVHRTSSVGSTTCAGDPIWVPYKGSG